MEELFHYIENVDQTTTKLLESFSYEDLKRKFIPEDQERLKKLKVVDEGEESSWLIPYWCGKDIRGLIKMPFSRHWIMHIEASLRILNKIS